MKPNSFPPGWNEDRVKDVLAHYGSQSDDAAAAEDEVTSEALVQTAMWIPTDLVPAVRELIAKHNAA